MSDLAEVIARVKSVANLSGCGSTGLLAFNWNRDEKWDVFIYDLSRESINKITSSPDSSLFPRFSNKGDKIVFSRDRDGDENYQIYIYDLVNKTETQLTNDYKYYHTRPVFSPGDDKIAFLSNRGGRPLQIFLWRRGEFIELTKWSEPIFVIDWLSEREIVYVKGIYNNELRIIDVEDLSDELLLKFNGSEISLGDVDRSRRRVLFTSNRDEWFDIGEYYVDEGKWEWIYRSGYEKYDPKYRGDEIFFVELVEGVYYLKSFHREDPGKTNIVARGVVEYEIFGRNIAYVTSLSDKPSSLVVNGREVIDNTPQILRGKLVKVYVDYYKSFDGRDIQAIIYKPHNWNKIAVINIHGGPDANAADTWNPLTQLLALEGYMVILPNYRGSTGFGKTFQHLNDKDLGGGDLRDVIYAAKYARSLGAEKLVVLGASYGGYLTAMALTKASEEWDAGVAIVGFYNWYTEYEKEADYLKAYDSIKMDPSLFRERSPIFFVENIRAPVLFIHGANDPRCPVEEVYQITKKLSELGRSHDLLIFPDEGHGVRKDSNRVVMYRKIIEFLNKVFSRGSSGL